MTVDDELDFLRTRLREYQDLEKERLEGHKIEAQNRRKSNARSSRAWGTVSLIFLILTFLLREGYLSIEWSLPITLIASAGFGLVALMEKDRL